MRDYPTVNNRRITVTGTKGKSTIVYLLADILQRNHEDVLRVDTTGHYINGKQKSTLDDSRRVSGLVPTLAPGRYLTDMIRFDRFVAVLEASVGSSGPAGLGYKQHDVGIFTNVFKDHLGSSERLQTQADIARAKNFVFTRLKPNGYAVFNAADVHVCSQLDELTSTDITRIACVLPDTKPMVDLDKHLTSGGVLITMDGSNVVLRTAKGDQIIADTQKISWTFDSQYPPSLWNAMFLVGGLYGCYEGNMPEQTQSLLEQSKLDPYGGRLTPLRAGNGALIIADYAHEKTSLAAIGDLAKKLIKPGGKVIGVVRLAYDRTNELIQETGEHIATHFDSFVVYDKIDGHWKKPQPTLGSFKQKTGYISEQLTKAIRSQNSNVERIIREDEALVRAAALAQPEDVVVCIVNDDIRRSIDFIRDAFEADFV